MTSMMDLMRKDGNLYTRAVGDENTNYMNGNVHYAPTSASRISGRSKFVSPNHFSKNATPSVISPPYSPPRSNPTPKVITPSPLSLMATFVMDYREAQTNAQGPGSSHQHRPARMPRAQSRGRGFVRGVEGSDSNKGVIISPESSFDACSVLDDTQVLALSESSQATTLRHKFFAGWLNALMEEFEKADQNQQIQGANPSAAGSASASSGLPRNRADTSFDALASETLVVQASDAKTLLRLLNALTGRRHNKFLAKGSTQTARLANLTIVLRLIKRELKPCADIKASVQKDVLAAKPVTVLNLLWCMVGARLVRRLNHFCDSRVERVSELPLAALHWAKCLALSSENDGGAGNRGGGEAARQQEMLLEELRVEDLEGVTGEGWMSGKLLLHLMVKVEQLRRHRIGCSGGGTKVPTEPHHRVEDRNLNEWQRLLDPTQGPSSKVACWAAALGGLSKCLHALPEGLLEPHIDCLVVWKSPPVMTLLLVELMNAAGTAHVPGFPDYACPSSSPPPSFFKVKAPGGKGGQAERIQLSRSLSPLRNRFNPTPTLVNPITEAEAAAEVTTEDAAAAAVAAATLSSPPSFSLGGISSQVQSSAEPQQTSDEPPSPRTSISLDRGLCVNGYGGGPSVASMVSAFNSSSRSGSEKGEGYAEGSLLRHLSAHSVLFKQPPHSKKSVSFGQYTPPSIILRSNSSEEGSYQGSGSIDVSGCDTTHNGIDESLISPTEQRSVQLSMEHLLAAESQHSEERKHSQQQQQQVGRQAMPPVQQNENETHHSRIDLVSPSPPKRSELSPNSSSRPPFRTARPLPPTMFVERGRGSSVPPKEFAHLLGSPSSDALSAQFRKQLKGAEQGREEAEFALTKLQIDLSRAREENFAARHVAESAQARVLEVTELLGKEHSQHSATKLSLAEMEQNYMLLEGHARSDAAEAAAGLADARAEIISLAKKLASAEVQLKLLIPKQRTLR